MRNFLSISDFLAILPGLYIGSISDQVGRRKPLLVSFITCICVQILLIVGSVFTNLNLFFLIYICAFLIGITGTVMNVTANVFGYISDISNDDDRTFRIIMVEFMIYLGSSLGYILAAVLLNYVLNGNHEYGFIITSAIYIINVIYILYYLKESRDVKDDFNLKNVFKSDHIISIGKTVVKSRAGCGRAKILLLLTSAAFSITNSGVLVNLIFPYFKNLQLDSSFYGLYNSLRILSEGVAILIVLPSAVKFFPNYMSDTVIGILGFFSKFTGLAIMGIATTPAHIFLSVLLSIFNGFTMPATRSILSKIVDEDERGKLFALIASIQNFVLCMSNFVFAWMFSSTIHFFLGFSFEIVAIFQFISLIIYL
ncbi:proton-coupled folate transporter-like protein [Dinothrombium tinctorium]|uniref:Proton-coupled folate transporter-like protein n=1 Tax=Dinothrombium tinctorium TaxID=1965070 RepID=A0A3S3RSG0_9ACAR|nr:proton-coupled folate transporter-like protein [Dinothrombium tinctorium]RWS06808.1 proton-coupled folate transporter-like protein [Dinothrombium tinctorium]